MIQIITGLPRMGKTITMVEFAQEGVKEGRKVITNFPCFGCDMLKSKQEVLDFLCYCDIPDGALIILAECWQIFNCREWKSMPEGILEVFTQHGKKSQDLILDVQSIKRIDTSIRELGNFFIWVERPWYDAYRKRGIPFLQWIQRVSVYMHESEVRIEGKEIKQYHRFINKKLFSYYDSNYIHLNSRKTVYQLPKWPDEMFHIRKSIFKKIKEKLQKKTRAA